MAWDSEVATEWLKRLLADCAKEFVAKWQSTFVRSGWLPGTRWRSRKEMSKIGY